MEFFYGISLNIITLAGAIIVLAFALCLMYLAYLFALSIPFRKGWQASKDAKSNELRILARYFSDNNFNIRMLLLDIANDEDMETVAINWNKREEANRS